jgi:hypothetical protein
MVVQDHQVDLDEVARWSKGEGKEDEYKNIEARLRKASK